MLFDFFYLVSELKKVPRKGWKEKVGIDKPESVADHSFGMAIMAMIFSDIKELDTEKIVKMALLHDLAESITGDFIPNEISKENKKIVENDSMEDILSKLPSNIVTQYREIWREFQEGKTGESILLHDIDRLEMAVQATKYFSEGHPKEKLQEFIESARKEIKSKELLEVLDTISYK
ncbi:MAG: HD domain-containing protein [Nitrosotalea sp.]